MDALDLCTAFGVTPENGLDSGQAAARLRQYGPNRIEPLPVRSSWRILLDQLKSLVVLLLAAAMSVALLMGDRQEALAILVVLCLNTAIGFFTERKALRSMDALRALGRVETVVRRGGKQLQVPAESLVPGDIVIVEAGDIVTADLRILSAVSLAADESALTGESVAVDKTAAVMPPETPLSERGNMLHKASVVTRGNAEAVVSATGHATEVGQIAELVDRAETVETPLEKQLERLGRTLIWLTLILVSLLMLLALATGRDFLLSLETAIALAVAAIPEGLPIVATLALARGMWRMAARNALISRLAAVETLGATSVILTDKTGTLTENRMRVACYVVPDDEGEPEIHMAGEPDERPDPDAGPVLQRLLRTAVLVNTASLDDGHGVGDPLEIALLEGARIHGIDRRALLQQMPELDRDPFESGRQCMATIHGIPDGRIVAVKGAPERLLEQSVELARGMSIGPPLSAAGRRLWMQQTARMAADGLRVIAVAAKTPDEGDVSLYENLTLLGLVGLWDPPREDVPAAIATCQEAGIRVVMVTGDHPATADHVARAVGISNAHPAKVLQGETIEQWAQGRVSDKEVLAAEVCARCSPGQKLELLRLHQDAGHIVAMTGDGVNDAPALKQADIGIAMGVRGTAVAKQAASMILQDDAFSTIVDAVWYGRSIIANIRLFMLYLLSCNLSEILVVGGATAVGAPLPLTPLQILFLNLVTDVFPALALGVNATETDTMRHPPRDREDPLLTTAHVVSIATFGTFIAAVVLAGMWAAGASQGVAGEDVNTMVFLTLALAQTWHVFNCRERRTGLQAATLRNPWVWGAVALCLILVALAMYLPPLASALEMRPLDATQFAMVMGFSLLPLLFGHWIQALSGWLSDQLSRRVR